MRHVAKRWLPPLVPWLGRPFHSAAACATHQPAPHDSCPDTPYERERKTGTHKRHPAGEAICSKLWGEQAEDDNTMDINYPARSLAPSMSGAGYVAAAWP